MSNDRKPNSASPGATPEPAAGESRLVPGPLASLETTLPPTPLKKLLAADGASIYVLTADPDLVEAVHAAAGEQFPVHDLTEWEVLVEHVEAGRCRIVLLDADLVRTGIEKRVARLQEVAADSVILVAATRDVAQNLIGLMSDRTIHRLLIKPAAVGITRLLLESAVSRFLQLRESGIDASPIVTPRRAPQDASPPTRLPVWAAAIAVVSLLIGALVATMVVRLDFGSSAIEDAPRADVTATGGAEAGRGSGAARPQLDRDAAGSAARTDPVDRAGGSTDSAVAGNATAADPVASATVVPDAATNDAPLADAAAPAAAPAIESAPESATDIAAGSADQDFEAGVARIEAALAAGDLTAAAADLDTLRALDPTSARLALLGARMQREIAALGGAAPGIAATAAAPDAGTESSTPASQAAALTPPPAVPAEPPSELDSLLTLARSRFENGQLDEPSGNSALDFYRMAAAIDAGNTSVVRFASELASVVVVRARVVLEDGDVDHAEALLDTARALGADPDSVVQLDIDLAAAIEQRAENERQAVVDSFERSLANGRLIAPADDNAVAALAQLETMLAGDPRLPAWRSRVGASLAAAAREAMGRADWTRADALVETLEARPDLASGEAVPLRRDLETARRQEALLAEPAPPGELTVLSGEPARYPPEARSQEIEGWVDVGFVIDAEGVPRALEVVDADPAGWFEETALAAVAGYRFAPYVENGQVFERRAQLRVRFGLR